MIEQLCIQTCFKRPYRWSSNDLATHTPYNPRRRLKTPVASERLNRLCEGGDANKEFHLPMQQAWNITAAVLRAEGSRMRRSPQRRREAIETPREDKATTVAAGDAS